MEFEQFMAEARSAVDSCLDRLLPRETEQPATIHKAMRYSVLAGGKRLRPVLTLASGEALGGARDTLLQLGSAVEMVHTYSLIHDDLPALDNDDLRRGRATCHKVFGDAIAILAGDSLMTRAYQIMTDLAGLPDATRLRIIREIACATGTVDGMIGGQVVDLESTGKTVTPLVLEYIHRSKTGALLTACTRCGAIAAGAGPEQVAMMTDFGRKLGLAFQIVDDILDVTLPSECLGKTAGKDQKDNKATYPALFGLEASSRKARELVEEAAECVRPLGARGEILRNLAFFVCDRHA